MRKWVCVVFLLFVALPCCAENYLLNGGQASELHYTMVQEIVPAIGTKKLIVSYVVPQTFTSPSYNQFVEDFRVTFSVPPYATKKRTDRRGNQVVEATWDVPRVPISLTISLKAVNKTTLQPLETDASFPPTPLPDDVKPYLSATRLAPSDNPQIIRMAKLLTSSAMTQFDAVQQILAWVVDHMSYVLKPKSYSAIYSIRSGLGNCQNYSHVAAALMRAVGIPVRIVNGVTLGEPYHVGVRGGRFTMRMAQGRHSWIEVYFPDLGWVPFDPQQMQLFVSNRFIRVEIGLDNEETAADGTIMWTRYRGTRGMPQFRESIDVAFVSDEVNLSAERQAYGPRKLLFSPPVEAFYTEVAFEHAEAVPPVVPAEELKAYTYDESVMLGNLEFPRGVDFVETRGPAEETEDGTMVMQKNFLVETSEYVTTQGKKYAQTFILEDPLRLEEVGLALHKFGGEGQVWVELFEDDGSGKPGERLVASEILGLDNIPFSPGYDWVDFSFAPETVTVSPGRYWIALGYTGSPVVNWFFTYGKPVGPSDGTRYNTLFDETWSSSLTYEFNYRIVGKKGRK